MTRYLTWVADAILAEIVNGEARMPDGLRLVRQSGDTRAGATLVEFEDDEAPAELEGAIVNPWMRTDGVRTWIFEREVVTTKEWQPHSGMTGILSLGSESPDKLRWLDPRSGEWRSM